MAVLLPAINLMTRLTAQQQIAYLLIEKIRCMTVVEQMMFDCTVSVIKEKRLIETATFFMFYE